MEDSDPATESKIKALTLWQPYASLMAFEFKRNETRSWATSYRGPLLITAARRKIPAEERAFFESHVLLRWAIRQMGGYEALPLGAALCKVSLKNMIPSEEAILQVSPMEFMCGNYEPGRFAWQTDELERFPHPFPCRGRQGLWDCDLLALREKAAAEDRGVLL